MDKDKAQGIGCLMVIAAFAAVWVVSAIGPEEPEFITIAGTNGFAMVMPEGFEGDQIEAAAREKCASLRFCKVFGWTSEDQAAKALPMLPRELEALAFTYSLNRSSGYEQVTWDCRRFPQAAPERCLIR